MFESGLSGRTAMLALLLVGALAALSFSAATAISPPRASAYQAVDEPNCDPVCDPDLPTDGDDTGGDGGIGDGGGVNTGDGGGIYGDDGGWPGDTNDGGQVGDGSDLPGSGGGPGDGGPANGGVGSPDDGSGRQAECDWLERVMDAADERAKVARDPSDKVEAEAARASAILAWENCLSTISPPPIDRVDPSAGGTAQPAMSRPPRQHRARRHRAKHRR